MRKILFSALVLCFVVSCNKDEDTVCTYNQASIAGTWKLTAAKYKMTPASAEVDVYALLDACEKDDNYVLNANGTYAYNDVGTICAPPGGYTGVWTASGTNVFTIDGDPGTASGYSCNSIVITFNDYNVAGDVLVMTFAKQ